MVEEEYWIFIVDTDTYSGNFERELCAYIAGHFYARGEEEAIQFIKETKLGHLERSQHSQKLIPYSSLEHVMEAPSPPAEHKGDYGIIWATLGWFNDGSGNHYPKETKKHLKKRYPAYQSVAIYFDTKPTEKEIAMFKDRSRKFAETRKIQVTGFRLIAAQVVQEEISI